MTMTMCLMFEAVVMSGPEGVSPPASVNVVAALADASARRPTSKTAERAAKSGLTKVGVLDSSRYASLQPGYYVVFTGVYGSKSDADAAVATARQAGFGGAYTRQVAS